MIRVHPTAVLAASQLVAACFEVVESHGEVPQVPPRVLQPKPSGSENANADECQDLESDQRSLLRELVDGAITSGEH